MTNKELDKYIVKFLEGDESSFDIIYNETQKSVYLSIHAINKNQVEIEDLMQDAYMKAIRSLGSYKIGTNFKAWISRIARNTALNHYNRQKREVIVDAVERPDIYGTTEDKYLIDFATKNLSDIEREIVIYKIVLDLNFREIGEIMDIPLGTVYWNYRNAIKQMKEEIEE